MLQSFSFGFSYVPEYVSPLRSLLSNNFFSLLLPTTVSLQLVTFPLLTGSWQFVIFLPTKGLLHTSFHSMTASLHKLMVTPHTQNTGLAICSPCQQALLPRSGPHPKQHPKFWLVATNPAPTQPPPLACATQRSLERIISKETGKDIDLEKREQSQNTNKKDLVLTSIVHLYVS